MKTSWSLANLCRPNDKDFINQAYRIILLRQPDASGFDNYLSALRTGRLSKIEVIALLRFSGEGRAVKARISGLLPSLAATFVARLPRRAVGWMTGRDSDPPPPLHPLDSVISSQLSMLLKRTAEQGAAIEMLSGLPEGLRELRRSEQTLRRQVDQLKEELEYLKQRQ